jgi:hypothetical protein
MTMNRVLTFMRGGDDKRIDGVPVHGWKEQYKPVEAANIRCYVLIADIERLARIYGDEPWVVSRIGYVVSNHLREMTDTVENIVTNFERRTRPKRMDIIATIGPPPLVPSGLDRELEDIAHSE